MNARIGDCGHPECTGQHRTGDGWVTLCPASKENARAWRIKDYASSKQAKYVYAILVNDTHLKIGCSTLGDGYQKKVTRSKFNKLFGPAQEELLLWKQVGTEGLEVFIQWRAGRTWKPLLSGPRHSEWFDVTGIDPKDVVKHLRRWYAQVELLDEWDAAEQAAPAE